MKRKVDLLSNELPRLKSEISSLAKFPAEVALKHETAIASLKSTINQLVGDFHTLKSYASVLTAPSNLSREKPAVSYASVVAAPPSHKEKSPVILKRSTALSDATSSPRKGSPVGYSHPYSRPSHMTNGESVIHSSSKVKVQGARKIWGTSRECTTKSVKNVIARVCNMNKGVYMKRKVAENPQSKKSNWWFVLHGNESVLCDLERKGPLVYSQKLWKLQPCFKSSSPSHLAEYQPSPPSGVLPSHKGLNPPSDLNDSAVVASSKSPTVAESSISPSEVDENTVAVYNDCVAGDV